MTFIPSDSHSGFYFPPSASKDRAVHSMEIKDFIILWTYSQWRQAIVVIPPLSREGNMWYPSTFLYSNKVESTIHRLRRSPFLSRKEHRFSCFPLISFRTLALCKKRTFCFIPVICKDCTILSREWHNHSCGLMVCFKAGDWTLCTILGYGLPERKTCCMLSFPIQTGWRYVVGVWIRNVFIKKP